MKAPLAAIDLVIDADLAEEPPRARPVPVMSDHASLKLAEVFEFEDEDINLSQFPLPAPTATTHTIKKWRAKIRVGGKPQHLGYFVEEAEAAAAYKEAAAAKAQGRPIQVRTNSGKRPSEPCPLPPPPAAAPADPNTATTPPSKRAKGASGQTAW